MAKMTPLVRLSNQTKPRAQTRSRKVATARHCPRGPACASLLYAMAGRQALVVSAFGLSLVAYLMLAFVLAVVLQVACGVVLMAYFRRRLASPPLRNWCHTRSAIRRSS